jgi:transcriptional regulator with XRE-family HTH domain
MDFGEQIMSIRLENNLTQEQMASKLNVTRQAVSNWEGNRNLPDIEMLITISNVFHLSLDQLILGGENMSNIKEKLIRDGSETRRARLNLISIAIGAALLLFGFFLILIKGASVEYIDESGILHENFFLLPFGFLLIFGGFITFLVTGFRHMISRFKNKN